MWKSVWKKSLPSMFSVSKGGAESTYCLISLIQSVRLNGLNPDNSAISTGLKTRNRLRNIFQAHYSYFSLSVTSMSCPN